MADKVLDTPEKKTVEKLFFPNLDGVRAMAALLIVVSHIELHKTDFNIPRLSGVDLSNVGKLGVSVFFSLSGFLITYLLLEERKNHQKINFTDFYVRRSLRIWPLYFVVIIVGFFIYPKSGSTTALWLSVFFLPNVAFCLNLLPAIIDPIWSIGIEEQFYIFHPHLFRIKKLQHILNAIALLIVIYLAAFAMIRYFNNDKDENSLLNQFLYYARYDNMLVGAAVAILYYNTRNKVFKFRFQYAFNMVFYGYTQVLLLFSFFGFIFLYINYTIPQGDLIISSLSALLIVNLCEPGLSLYSLNGPAIRFIGRISYGIYLLHKFPIFFVLYLVSKYMRHYPVFLQNLVIFPAVFLLIIALAAASYYGFERYFLQLKKRFQRIPKDAG